MYSEKDIETITQIESRLVEYERDVSISTNAIFDMTESFQMFFRAALLNNNILSLITIAPYHISPLAFPNLETPVVIVDYTTEYYYDVWSAEPQFGSMPPHVILSKDLARYRREVGVYEFTINSIGKKVEKIYEELAALIPINTEQLRQERSTLYLHHGMENIVKTKFDIVSGRYSTELEQVPKEEIVDGFPSGDVVIECPSNTVDLEAFLPFIVARMHRDYHEHPAKDC